MKKLLTAVAVTGLLGVGTANAGFYCSVTNAACDAPNKAPNPQCQKYEGSNYANEKHLEWHFGMTFPDTTPFKYESQDVVCFVDGGILYNVMPNIAGFPKIPSLSSGPTQGPGSGPKSGVVYRGDNARWLIDNLRSYPLDMQGIPNVATPVTRDAFFNTIKP